MYCGKVFPFFALISALPLFGQSSGPSSWLEAARPARHQHRPIRIREERSDGSVTSDNWSGYAVTATKDTVTAVEGSWIVPMATCSGSGPSTGYAAFWVGIDGYTSASVEQTGTDSDCSSGSPVYYAWYEFYPEPSFEVKTITVLPGDVMSASVVYSGREFTVTITDERTGETFSKTKTVRSAKRSSAEWIAEAPSSGSGVLPLSDFGTVFFGQDSTGISGTNDATISSITSAIGGFAASNIKAITMESSGTTEAVPTALSSDASSFSVQWF